MFGKSKKNKIFFSLHMQNITEGIMYSQMIEHNKTHIISRYPYFDDKVMTLDAGYPYFDYKVMALDAGYPYFDDKVMALDSGYPYFDDKVIALDSRYLILHQGL
jgi:hypothetical protein